MIIVSPHAVDGEDEAIETNFEVKTWSRPTAVERRYLMGDYNLRIPT